jgi:hypothetical protein
MLGFDRLIYRVHRLRRLVVVTSIAPVALAVFAFGGSGVFGGVLLLALALAPLAHVLIYPNAWMETIVVSLTVTSVLAFAVFALCDPALEIGVFGWAALAAFGVVLFLGGMWIVPSLLLKGPGILRETGATGWSRLDADTLRRVITLYPGRHDCVATCGEADENGRFAVTLHLQRISASEDVLADIDRENVRSARGEGGEVALEMDMIAEVAKSDDGVHEVITCIGGEAAASVSRHTFVPENGGTRVTVTEYGTPLSPGLVAGMYLQDYMADYLTSEIDRAEGRPARANRAEPVNQLVVDIARRFFPVDPASDPEG